MTRTARRLCRSLSSKEKAKSSIMLAITLLVLINQTLAHMYMSSPNPRFTEAFQNDKRSPSIICGLVNYSPGAASVVIPQFNNGLRQTGFSSVKAFADACGKPCGNTIPSTMVPFPADNTVSIDIGADHIGPSEIWVDDNLVMSNPGLDGSTVKKTPPSTQVDFAKACPSGTCQVRFVMAALHNSPAEIFDNCVTITTAINGNKNIDKADTSKTEVNGPSSTSVPALPSKIGLADTPAITSYARAESTSTPFRIADTLDWACQGENLLAISSTGQTDVIACPNGTKCQTDGYPFAICV